MPLEFNQTIQGERRAECESLEFSELEFTVLVVTRLVVRFSVGTHHVRGSLSFEFDRVAIVVSQLGAIVGKEGNGMKDEIPAIEPRRPRTFGGKGAEGLKKKLPTSAPPGRAEEITRPGVS